jgi:hypothetical protein
VLRCFIIIVIIIVCSFLSSFSLQIFYFVTPLHCSFSFSEQRVSPQHIRHGRRRFGCAGHPPLVRGHARDRDRTYTCVRRRRLGELRRLVQQQQ